jgi:hypothetical protein
MQRILFASGVLVLLVVVVAAQPPVSPMPPAGLPVAPGMLPVVPPAAAGEPIPPTAPMPLPMVGAPMPAVPPTPAVPAETLMSKFEPLGSFPAATQYAVSGVIRGSQWMTKMHQPHGRFLIGYNPALRQAMPGDHDLNQAHAALAMAQTAKFSGDKTHAVIASQAILALRATTKVEATDPNCRVPMQMSFVCNRVGFAAILALAIYELPNAASELTDDAERLCEFLRRQCRADGSVQLTDGAEGATTQTDAAGGVNEYPGFALQALAVSNRMRPADWKKEVVKRGITYYANACRAKPHPMLAATVTPAATEFYLQTKLDDALTVVFEMNDWLSTLQIASTDPRTPQWAGGFRTVVNGQPTDTPSSAVETAMYLQSLSCAYQLTRLTADLTRERRYRAAVTDAAQFLCSLQFAEANTRHFEDSFRASMLIGGFHLSPSDGNLPIEATACSVTGLLRFLSCGAERR